jgi:lipopolysaccharide transport system ATP-binding protein
MADTVIQVENVSKRYSINSGANVQNVRLSELLNHSLNRWSRKLLRPLGVRQVDPPAVQEFWALRDVSFEVNRGEVLGLVGKNGAGKSTLLKIISRITAPTRGQLRIRGRVVSLLEVGTGFHPDLTGRENVFLNGAILGMTRSEIKQKFDEIVAFAEVDQFIDTPVKFYSSGMYTRLAFAVAAHMEPEILILDEVLAVGDTQFQKKCMQRMNTVACQGHSVLFVSHNPTSILKLCPRAVLLEGGRVVAVGNSNDVLTKYATPGQQETPPPANPATSSGPTLAESVSFENWTRNRTGDQRVAWTQLSFFDRNGEPTAHPKCGEPLHLRVDYRTTGFVHPESKFLVGISINHLIEPTSVLCTNDFVQQIQRGWPRVGSLSLRIPELPLTPGRYYVNLYLGIDGTISDYITEAANLLVEPGDFFGTGQSPSGQSSSVLVRHSWEVASSPSRQNAA